MPNRVANTLVLDMKDHHISIPMEIYFKNDGTLRPLLLHRKWLDCRNKRKVKAQLLNYLFINGLEISYKEVLTKW